MATDQLDSAGIYIGTSTGQVFASRDSGGSWEPIVEYLPRILSVETATFN
jgi:ethanolamine utilization protein EutA (predicted chaperonin)